MGNSVSAESVCRRFIRFRRRGANRGPVTPLQSCKKVHPPPLLDFEGQLPPPAWSSVPTSREAHSVSGPVSVGPVHSFDTRSAERSRAKNAQADSNPEPESDRYFRTIHGPVTPIPQQSLGYDTRDTGEQTARSPTSLAIGQCQECLPKVHPFQ